MKLPLNPLPKSFVLGKPQQPKDTDSTRADIATRKRDGYKTYAVITKRGATLYTSGCNKIDGRLAHIAQELKSYNLRVPALLIGECVASEAGKPDDLHCVQAVMKADKEKAIALQEQHGKLHLMVFGVVLLGGKDVTNVPYIEMLGMIYGILYKNRDRAKYIFPAELIALSSDGLDGVISGIGKKLPGCLEYSFSATVATTTLEAAKRKVIENDWEGLVLCDKDFKNTFRLDGKEPQRPRGCRKWKPIAEDDFIVEEWTPDENNKRRVKELILLQIDPVTKEKIECGKFGHLSEERRKQLAKERYPIVVQIRFGVRYPSGKLRDMQELLRIRDDKKPSECFAPQSYASQK